jgi:hypothetical protein
MRTIFHLKTAGSLLLLLLLLCMGIGGNAQPIRVEFENNVTVVPVIGNTSQGNVILRIKYKVAEEARQRVKEYLENPSVYEFRVTRPETTEAVAPSSNVLPFVLSGAIQADQPFILNQRAISLPGYLPLRSAGVVEIIPPDAASGLVFAVKGGQDGEVLLDYSTAEVGISKTFSTLANIGVNEGAVTIDFAGEGRISGKRELLRGRMTSLSLAGRLPLFDPDDVRTTAGASRDASRQVTDLLELGLNSVRYKRGGSLEKSGLKLRTTGSLRGFEGVAYYSPLAGPLPKGWGYGAAELEIGYRAGDAEFSNLTTRAADTGNFVARLGAVLELTPRLEPLGINRNLNQGLRFFARVRGWLDTFEGVNNTGARLRFFADSELFYNFTANSRVFLRAEAGYLPPDLSSRSERIYVGVGASF